VLTVGTWQGHKGAYPSIQAAVDAASPGDWILIAPGDYRERGDYLPGHQAQGEPGAGVWISKPNIHLRGLSRTGVIVDGTRSGPACSSAAGDQDLGPGNVGRNGIEVFEASGVTIENLTACNWLSGADGTGNQIWWNGGYDTGQIHMHSYSGAYLTATSSFYKDAKGPQGTYGIFVSSADGPGRIDHTYASNMNDSGYYIGACRDCNAVLNDAHAQNNVLGYSGTNSGGHLVISNGEWDQNGEGLDTNSASDDDLPAPQDGACPGTGRGIAGSHSCLVITGNYIHDNNNRDVPGNGLGLVGVGLTVAGGRNDTIVNNTFARNGAWAVVLAPYITDAPEQSGRPDTAQCTGAGGTWANPLVDQLNGGPSCFFDDYGNTVASNTFTDNGGFGQPTNGDLAELNDFTTIGVPAPPTPNCWHDNRGGLAGVTSAPANLQVTGGCGAAKLGAGPGDPLFGQILCNLRQLPPNDQAGFCNGASYPQQTAVRMAPLPRQISMPKPCVEVPADVWCAR